MERYATIDPQTITFANESIARTLDELGDLLEGQQANPYRVRAYRNAARVVRSLDREASTLSEAELEQLPGIGRALARMIVQLARTGTSGFLEHLRSGAGPVGSLSTVPGIGPQLASRIHDRLHIDTLADLEAAAWDGRLAKVPGMGARRVRAVRESLAGRLARRGASAPSREPRAGQLWPSDPQVSELLELDEEYRTKAAAGRLPTIAPRRFNPGREAWLPVLHTRRGGRHYTVLYSNTARAHQAHATRDWVVIYRDDHEGDGQWTVITAKSGDLRGRRLIRGREDECRGHYARGPRCEAQSAEVSDESPSAVARSQK
jgi:hypothetical protein